MIHCTDTTRTPRRAGVDMMVLSPRSTLPSQTWGGGRRQPSPRIPSALNKQVRNQPTLVSLSFCCGKGRKNATNENNKRANVWHLPTANHVIPHETPFPPLSETCDAVKKGTQQPCLYCCCRSPPLRRGAMLKGRPWSSHTLPTQGYFIYYRNKILLFCC